MTKNLETADHVAKLILALATVVFYFTGVINGAVGKVLMILGLVVLLIFVTKVMLSFLIRD